MVRDRGFSLIELLVVVSVVVVLVGLLLPAISLTKAAARRLGCSSNLRQIGLAILAYANDHDGTFPYHNMYSCDSWPYIFGDWGTDAWWGGRTGFYADYMPANRKLYYCPEGLLWQSGTGSDIDRSWQCFPAKPPTQWITCTNYCYYAGPDENGVNRRGGPRGTWDGTARSTLIADLMGFGPTTDYTMVSNWNHLGGPRQAAGNRLDGRSGGNMFHLDGHLDWTSGVAELLRHRQAMKGNNSHSYAAEEKNDP